MRVIKKNNVQEPRVSWLICCNQENSFLFNAIDSCLNQTFEEFEIVVICNGTLRNEIADSLIDKYINEERLTIIVSDISFLTHSLNLGLDFCRAEFVARMDADDLCLPDRLEKQMSYMLQNPNVAVLGSSYKIIDEEGRVGDVVELPVDDVSIRDRLFWTNPICHPSVVYKRDLIRKAGGYMGGVQAEDYDLWLRLHADDSIVFAAIAEPLLLYRSNNISNSRKSARVYASVASAQFRKFVEDLKFRWLFAACYTMIKRVVGCSYIPN